MKRGLRRTGYGFLVGVMVLVLVVVAACGGGETTPTTTSPGGATSPTIPTTTAPTGKAIEVKFHNPWPATHHLAVKVFDPWAKMVEEQTQGRVKIVFYHGGALGGAGGVYDAVKGRAAEMGVWIPYSKPATFPLTMILHLPFAVPDSAVGDAVYYALYDKYFAPEFAEVPPYALFSTDVYPIWTTKKKVVTPQDVSGLKLRASGIQDKVVTNLGGTPLSVTAGDVYPNMQKGVIDGAVYSWTGAWGLKLQEVSSYVTKVDMGVVASSVIMNKEFWESLPADIKQVFNDLVPEMRRLVVADYVEGVDEVYAEIAKLGKPQIVDLTPDVMAQWKAVGIPLWDEWAEEMEGKGLPGKQVLADFKEALKAQGVTLPE